MGEALFDSVLGEDTTRMVKLLTKLDGVQPVREAHALDRKFKEWKQWYDEVRLVDRFESMGLATRAR